MCSRFWSISLLLVSLLRSEAAAVPDIPFQFHDGLIWIDVKIGQNRETYHFLLDSGANVSVIDLALAKKLGVKLGRQVAVQGVQSEVAGYWRSSLAAAANGMVLPRDYLALDLSALSGECKTPIDGLIGMDFFKDRVTEIDFESSRIRFLNSSPDVSASVPLEKRAFGLRLPIAMNGGKSQWVRLDTGCASALQWVAPEVKMDACQGSKVAVGLAPILVPQSISRVEIGPFSFDEIPTGVHAKAIFAGEAGLLGNDLLRKFKRVTIDLKRNRLHLEPSMNDLTEKH